MQSVLVGTSDSVRLQILAQCLVRRTLFPGSDCLKWKDRQTLTDQIMEYSPDVACLQVVS